MSTQNVAGAELPTVLRDSQSEFPNNQATVCEENPNGSKVPRESLLGCCLRKFTKICFCHWLLCYWLIKCIPSNIDSELWNHLEFFHKLSFVWSGTSMSYPPYPLMGPTWCSFWVLTHRNSKCILSFGVECICQPHWIDWALRLKIPLAQNESVENESVEKIQGMTLVYEYWCSSWKGNDNLFIALASIGPPPKKNGTVEKMQPMTPYWGYSLPWLI